MAISCLSGALAVTVVLLMVVPKVEAVYRDSSPLAGGDGFADHVFTVLPGGGDRGGVGDVCGVAVCGAAGWTGRGWVRSGGGISGRRDCC